jgi:hypothetical protein
MIPSIVFSGRQIDKAFTMESYQNFTASHILETTVCLNPIPFLAEYFGDLSAGFIPMLVNSNLNQFKIGLGDGSFPGGNG